MKSIEKILTRIERKINNLDDNLDKKADK